MKNLRASFLTVAVLAIALTATAPPSAATTSRPGVGVNTYHNDWYFVNLMKVGGFFQYNTTPLSFDTNGWPTTDCGISFAYSGHYNVTGITGIVDPNISGTYYLQFQCANSAVVVSNAGTSGNAFTITNQSYNSGTQTWSGNLVFTATTGYLSPSFTDTNGGIRNVLFLLPGYPANTTQVFTNWYTSMMAPFGTFRPLSDQGEGTWSYPATRQWAGRANSPNVPTLYDQDGSFTAWEWQIMLANTANSNLWICVPVNATDDYVSQLASLIKNGDIVDGVSYPALNSNLDVYVEFTNELWNTQFFQFFYSFPAARAEINQGQMAAPLYLPGNGNYSSGTGAADTQFYYGEHAKHDSDIFRNIWGSANMMTRVRPVVMWQAGQIGQDNINVFVEQWYGPASQYFYGCGVATYFNPSASSSESEPQLITATEADVAGWNSNGFPIMRAVASEHGMQMDSYEGGTGVSLTNPMTQAEYNQIYDTQMSTITDNFYTDWFANGGDATNWVGLEGPATPASGAAYGLIEDPNNPSGSPRWNGAVTASAASPPAVTAGVTIASTGTTQFNGATYPDTPEGINPFSIGQDSNGNSYVDIGNNSAEYHTYLINTATAGNYSISVNSSASSAGTLAIITVDGVAAAEPTIPTTGMYPWSATTPFVINLSSGAHSLRITAINNFNITWHYENFLVTAGGTLTTNQKPSAPVSTGSYGENAQNLVVWTQASNNGSAVTSYNVYRSTASGGEGTTAYKTGIDALNYMDTSVSNNTTYYYTVTAVNANGESPQSGEISSAPTAKPGAPTNLTANYSSGSVTLTWTNPSGHIDLINIYRNSAPGTEPASPYSLTTVAASGTSYTDSGDVYSSAYYYKITAVNLAGEGSASNEASVTVSSSQTADPAITPYNWRDSYHSYGPLTVTITDATAGSTIYYTTNNTTPTTSSPVYTGSFTLNNSAQVNAIATKSGLSNSNQSESGYNVDPPLPPPGVAAAAGSGQVTVNWTAPSGATSYIVRQSTSNGGPYVSVGTSSSTSFTSTGLSGGTPYYFVVLSVGGSGQSGESYQASATPTGGGGAPAAPTGLSAAGGNATVALSWNSSSGATSYSVYRGATSGGESTTAIATGVTPTSYTDTSVSNGTTYYYEVKAANSSGTSGYSNEASATPAAGGGVLFSDNFEEDTVGGQASGWTVLYGTWSITHPSGETQEYASGGNSYTSAGSSTWTNYNVVSLFNTTASGTRLIGRLQDDNDWYDMEMSGNNTWQIRKNVSGTVTNLASGTYDYSNSTDYYLKLDLNGSTITAYISTNGGTSYTTLGSGTDTTYTSGKIGLASYGGSSTFDNVVVTSDSGGSAPAAPTGLTAAPGNSTVALSWNSSTGATSYNVYRGTTSGGESGTALATGIATTSYTDNAVTNGTTYFYEVKALNSSGTSGYSNEASAAPSAGSAPPAPTGLSATGGNASVALTWNSSTGATSYNVYRGTTSGGENSTALATGVTATSYTDSAAVNAATYYYEVKALNSSGTSGYSNEASAKTDLFYDNFEEDTVGGQATGWTVLYGTWQITHPSGETLEYASEGNSYTSAGSSSWTNYYVQCQFNAAATGTRLIGRLQDDNDWYDVEMSSNTTWQIRKNVSGTTTNISSGTYDYTNGTDYELKLDLNGSTLTAYISTNGGTSWTTLGSGTDTTYTSGKIGLASYLGATTFDNVAVVPH